MRTEKYEDFREYMDRRIDQHVGSVPGMLKTRELLKREIQEGMEATWHLALTRGLVQA